jgi:carbonic anhydrase
MHNCDAIIVCCIDFRFQNDIREWTDKNLGQKTFDLVGIAGSTKNLDTVLGQVDISVRLHGIKEAILIHHEECGAYGAESTQQRHAADLLLAKKTLLDKYPDLQVKCYYLKLNGEFTEVE